MDKIGIYTDPEGEFLVIETPSEIQFELSDEARRLLVAGNKLQQPSVKINIKNLQPGKYLLKITYEGMSLYQRIEL